MIALLRQVADGNSEGAQWTGMCIHRIGSEMLTERRFLQAQRGMGWQNCSIAARSTRLSCYSLNGSTWRLPGIEAQRRALGQRHRPQADVGSIRRPGRLDAGAVCALDQAVMFRARTRRHRNSQAAEPALRPHKYVNKYVSANHFRGSPAAAAPYSPAIDALRALISKTKRHGFGPAPETPGALEDQWPPSLPRRHFDPE
jgi:hypothetical protein